MKILLAEDDDGLREMLRTILVAAGYEVSVAADGDAACGEMPRGRFDGLVTDMLMPGRDGLEVIAKFRRVFPTAGVLAISGGSDLFQGELCLDLAKRLGANEVLEKPFSQKDLLRVMQKMLKD